MSHEFPPHLRLVCDRTGADLTIGSTVITDAHTYVIHDLMIDTWTDKPVVMVTHESSGLHKVFPEAIGCHAVRTGAR